MNTSSLSRWLFGGALLLAVGGLTTWAAFTCRADDPPKPAAEAKRKELGPNVAIEVQGDERRVIVTAAVVLREGRLEGLLCRKNTKEHEYILAADADARAIHFALVAAGAKAGSPVQFSPKFVPAHGTTIKVRLQYDKDGKSVTVPASEWVRDVKTHKDLDSDWVFGGSRFVADPDDARKPPIYLANQGDLICLCNMDTAMLDVPIASPKALDARAWEANTERVPPLETKVDVIFDIVRDMKDGNKDK